MTQRYQIPYGKKYQIVEIPSHLYVEEAGKDSHQSVSHIDIANLTLSEELGRFLKGARDLLVIINDHTRFTPSGEILQSLKDYVERVARFEVLIATGTHRPPTEFELESLLGPAYQWCHRHTRTHDCLDENAHYLAGTIPSGIDIFLDKAIDNYDSILVIGSVEPHFFSGFTGGRKGIFPGVALKTSIILNHVKAIDSDVQPLELDNPLHRDMDAAIDLLTGKSIFSIQTVHNPDRSAAGLFMGDIRGSFDEATKLARQIYVKQIDRQFDIVIAALEYPLDIDLYQVQKGFENSKFAVKSGGICILVSKCRDGVGPDDWMKLSSRYGSPQEVLQNSQDASMFGFHKLYRPARFMEHSKIFVVADVEPYLIKSVFLTPKADLQTAFDTAVKLSPPKPSVLILYDAGQNVISVSSDSSGRD